MPIASQPTRGYTDYQREGNFDTGSFFGTNVLQLLTMPLVSNLQDVSRYAYVAGTFDCGLGQIQIEFDWFLDGQASAAIGKRIIMVDANIAAIAQIRLPNLGPFLQITLTPVTANPECAWQFIASNRVYPLEMIPVHPVLIALQGQAINAGATLNLYPVDYYSGPVAVWYDPTFTTGNCDLQYLTTSGTWAYIDQLSHTTNGNNDRQWVVPTGAWRLTVGNTSAGNSSFFLGVTPSTTGST